MRASRNIRLSAAQDCPRSWPWTTGLSSGEAGAIRRHELVGPDFARKQAALGAASEIAPELAGAVAYSLT